MIRERILFRLFFSLLLLLSFSPFCTYEPTSQIHPNTYKIDDAVAFEIRAVSSAIGENAINQQVAEMIEQDVVDYEYSTRNTNGGNGGNYNHTYTVSVSTYTKAVNSSNVGGVIGGVDVGFGGINGGIIGGSVGAADPAVTFVAVQVVRTSTHQ